VILLNQPLGEMREIGIEYLEAASFELLERLFTAHKPERGAPFRTGFREYQSTVRKIERREPDLPGHLRPGGHPAKTAGDHEVDDEEEIVFELHDNALPHSPHADDPFPVCRADGWID
jgi:hypothetical protein